MSDQWTPEQIEEIKKLNEPEPRRHLPDLLRGNGAILQHADGARETVWVGAGELVEIPKGSRFIGYERVQPDGSVEYYYGGPVGGSMKD